MLKYFLIALGIILIAIGITGFLPALNQEAYGNTQALFGVFRVNIIQSFWYLLSGVSALAAVGTKNDYYMLNYLKIFGIIYAVFAVWGLPAIPRQNYDEVLFGLIRINAATEALNLLLAASMLYMGIKNPLKKTKMG